MADRPVADDIGNGADGGGEGFDIETTNPTAGIDVDRT